MPKQLPIFCCQPFRNAFYVLARFFLINVYLLLTLSYTVSALEIQLPDEFAEMSSAFGIRASSARNIQIRHLLMGLEIAW